MEEEAEDEKAWTARRRRRRAAAAPAVDAVERDEVDVLALPRREDVHRVLQVRAEDHRVRARAHLAARRPAEGGGGGRRSAGAGCGF